MRVLRYSRGQILVEGPPVFLTRMDDRESFPAYMYKR
jgi:hypothetical protein